MLNLQTQKLPLSTRKTQAVVGPQTTYVKRTSPEFLSICVTFSTWGGGATILAANEVLHIGEILLRGVRGQGLPLVTRVDVRNVCNDSLAANRAP